MITQADILQGILLAALERVGEGLAEADGSVDETTQDEVDAIAAQASPENIQALLAELNPAPEAPTPMSLYTPPVISDEIRRKVREQADRAFALSMQSFNELAEPKLLAVPDVRQEDAFSCGAAATMSAARYFHVGPTTLNEWRKELGTSEAESTHPSRIVDYLARLGLEVTATSGMTIDDLRHCWEQGWPVICPIREYGDKKTAREKVPYGHFVVVIGVALGSVIVQDPSIDNILQGEQSDAAPGHMMIPEKTWNANWHDREVDGQYDHFGIIVKGPKVERSDSSHLAEWYAEHWNHLAEMGQAVPAEEMDHARHELTGGDTGLWLDPESERWEVVSLNDKVQLSQERAPAGGVVLAGREYKGGMWIPSSVVANATPEEKARLDEAKAAAKEKRSSRGSVDTEKLKEGLKPHGHHELAEHELKSAKAAFRGLHRHHEDLTVHRIEELVNSTQAALDAIPEDHPNAEGLHEHFGRRLKAYEHMLEWAHERGVTGKVPEKVVEKEEKAAEPSMDERLAAIKQRELETPHAKQTKRLEGGTLDAIRDELRLAIPGVRVQAPRTKGGGASIYPPTSAPFTAEQADAVRKVFRKYGVVDMIDGQHFEPMGHGVGSFGNLVLDVDGPNPKYADEQHAGEKPDWQKTMGEYVESHPDAGKHEGSQGTGQLDAMRNTQRIINEHKEQIDKALADGKPVPADVMIDYPELAEKHQFTGTDSQGREWRDGRLVQASPPITHLEPSGPTPGIEPETPQDATTLKDAWSAALMASTEPGLSDAERTKRKAEADRLKEQWKAADEGKAAAPAEPAEEHADAVTEAKYKDKPDVQLLRAPAGGQVSDVNGEFYKGGRIMPVHGLTPKKEKTDETGTGSVGPVVGNENAKAKGTREPREPRAPLTPQETAEREAHREAMGKIYKSPLSELIQRGQDDKLDLTRRFVHDPGWRQYAETIGEDKLKELAAELRPLANQEELAVALESDFPNHYLPKKHGKEFPTSQEARIVLSKALDAAKSPTDIAAIGDILAKARDEATAPRTVDRREIEEKAKSHGFIPNRFPGYAKDGSKVAALEGFVRKDDDGKWKTYSVDEVKKAIEDTPQAEPQALSLVEPLSLVTPYRPPGYDELHDAIADIKHQLANREPLQVILPPQPAPVVNVTMPAINVAPPSVNVTTPEITVNVEPAPAPEVTVNLPAPGKTKKTVEYDTQGRPKSITEEPDTKEE